ncbi:hypothetical protein ACFRJ7_30025 [Streptomyces sp. NPDC056747]|uniref:hypothetical protein n=1 Tax=Streptomyces sp. NPDC056747 TaxID=3345935 RepID=UPI0036ADB615
MLATLTTILAPETIVIGCGICESGELLREPPRTRLAAPPHLPTSPPLITQATLGAKAGVLEAGLVALHAVSAGS